eukprot:Platyproteum_vivax@DN2355_c0_g1_i1.p2
MGWRSSKNFFNSSMLRYFGVIVTALILFAWTYFLDNPDSSGGETKDLEETADDSSEPDQLMLPDVSQHGHTQSLPATTRPDTISQSPAFLWTRSGSSLYTPNNKDNLFFAILQRYQNSEVSESP